MLAYYNENNAHAADQLELLIAEEAIAPGYVDRRDIQDIDPRELRGYAQHHFFAGIGVWSYALRCAGWPDDRPIWTGSCPCQPFSGAGAGRGFDDPRHLWPVWHRLAREYRPDVIVGEQVCSPDGRKWWDLVSSDLESDSYAAGALVAPAAGVGAPMQRHRLYWLAHATSSRFNGAIQGTKTEARDQARLRMSGEISGIDWLARALHPERGAISLNHEDGCNRPHGGWQETLSYVRARREVYGLADSYGRNASPERQQRSREYGQQPPNGRADETANASPLNGFWRDADWLACTDGKWRPVEPGTFPLASGIAGRVGALRGYGNAICAPQATAFIECVIEIIEDYTTTERENWNGISRTGR